MSSFRGAPPQDSTVERLLDLAEDALDIGDAHSAFELCQQALQLAPEHAGATFLSAESLRDLGKLFEAENAYRRVVHLTPDHSASWSALATVLFDQLRLTEATNCALRAIRLDPGNPEAYYARAMIRERNNDGRGARRDYLRAGRLDPLQYPPPQVLDDAVVEAVVEEALLALHPSIRSYLENVAILLEDVPPEDLCSQYQPPAPPGEILGYFAGVSLRDRSIENPWSTLPSAIVLFRKNLERIAWDRERMIDELRVTVFHEVGHFLGLDEAELEARGLD